MAEFMARQSPPKLAASRAAAASAATPPPDLVGAYRQVLEHEAQKALEEPERLSWWRRFGRPLVGVAIALVSGWLWILPPAWLVSDPVQTVTWPEGPTGSHLLLIGSADAIELFRQDTGRLPQRGEMDSVAPKVELRPLPDGGFELRSPTGYTLTAPPPGAQTQLGYELGDPPGTGQP